MIRGRLERRGVEEEVSLHFVRWVVKGTTREGTDGREVEGDDLPPPQ